MLETDSALLDRFNAHRDEAAFHELSRRHLSLIFHAALRRTGNRQIAEEVSQNVLCALAQKSPALAKHPERLPAWLHRATIFESSKAMRSESSHQRRKVLQHPDAIPATGPTDSPWSKILPHLDLALDRLSTADRTLLLQHYYEGKNFPALAAVHSSAPATVQKRCRRALDKLARILRGKNLVITTSVLAADFTAELAKAAPPALLKTAAAHALSATYSTTQLTLFMACKSKALIPLALLLALTPLILQQVAISRAVSHNESLRADLASNGAPTRQNRSPLPTANNRSPSGQITISTLSRALDKARSGSSLEYLDFEEMIAALTPEQLVALIPEAIQLPESRRKKSDLLEFLVKALAKSDPERAVKTTLTADPRGEIGMSTGLVDAFSAWTLKNPDAAFVLFQKLFNNRDFNPLTEGGFAWSSHITTLLNETAKSLVAVGSPHVRDLIFMAPESVRSSTFFNSVGMAAGNMGKHRGGDSSGISGQNFANYLPLIREFIPDKEHNQAFDRLVSDVSPRSKDFDQIIGEFADRSELLPTERSLLAGSYARDKIGTYYNTTPHPDLAAVENATRQWLEIHIPNEAEAIFAKARSDRYQQEMAQAKRRLESIAENPDLTDSNLIQELGSKVYGEMLPQALEQAARIKDPAKRAEVIHHLQNP